MSAATAVDRKPASRIVIVEDEAVLALNLERQLRELGYDVRGVAADSKEALELVARERPDLLLMDIRIQGSLDGIETAREVQQRHDVAVVYLTAHSDPTTIERAQATGPLGYLLKPFKKPDLQNVVRIALDRRENERALQRREEALRITLSCIDEAIVTTDLGGAVTSLNVAATQLVGRDDAALMQRPLAEVLPLRRPDGTRLSADPVAAAQAQRRVPVEGQLDTPRGARSVVGTAVALRQGGAPFGVVVALRDLTELLQARRQLEFAERLSALGTLAAGVAHEINNPLSVVLANLSFALGEQTDAEVHEALLEAHDAGRRVATIVADLRAFSKPQSESFSAIDPREPLVAALGITRSTWKSVAGVDLNLGPVPAVLASPTRLAQVLVNLIVNAVHAMKTVATREHRLTLTSSLDDSGRVALSVRDTGPGVPDPLRERVFEPFFTTKPQGEGTGLGLAISRSIVEQHGGRFELTSDENGACFTIRLPPGGSTPMRSFTRSRLCWVGAITEEARLMGCQPVAPVAADVRAALSEQPAVVIAALGNQAFRALTRDVPDLEAQAIHVSDEAPRTGQIRLVPPFDFAALAALQRRR